MMKGSFGIPWILRPSRPADSGRAVLRVGGQREASDLASHRVWLFQNLVGSLFDSSLLPQQRSLLHNRELVRAQSTDLSNLVVTL